MPAPTGYIYSTALNVSAQGLVKTALEAGSGAPVLNIYSETDVLLAAITLDDPVGTVDAFGGLAATATTGATAAATGTATWAEFVDSDDNSVLQAPVTEGTSTVSGKVVINATAITSGSTVNLVSASFGPNG